MASERAIPEDLKQPCPLCKGSGAKMSTSFMNPRIPHPVHCHHCKGTGQVWALDLQEMAERIADLERQLAEAQAKLAALETRYASDENQRLCVGYLGGCDGDLESMPHIKECPSYTRDIELNPHRYRA
jgi:hypothetical protein